MTFLVLAIINLLAAGWWFLMLARIRPGSDRLLWGVVASNYALLLVNGLTLMGAAAP